jgi:hypothetical protein
MLLYFGFAQFIWFTKPGRKYSASGVLGCFDTDRKKTGDFTFVLSKGSSRNSRDMTRVAVSILRDDFQLNVNPCTVVREERNPMQ